MAVVDPNEQTPAVAQQQPQTSAPVSSGGAGVAGSSKPAASTPGVNVPAQPSAQLSAYLNSNANQAGAQAIGSNVAGQVGQSIRATQNAINPAVNVYTGQLYTVPTDTTTNQLVETAPSDLTAPQQQSYENELGATANIPNSADTFETTSGYSDLSSQIQAAVEQANLWNSSNNPANLMTAMQPYESPNATTGDTTLDALLLSNMPSAYSQIQQALAPATETSAGVGSSPLEKQLATTTTGADQALQNAIAEDKAATPAAQQAAQTYATNLTNYLNNALTTAQTAYNAANTESNQLATDLGASAMTAADAEALGIPAAQAQAYASAVNNVDPAISAEEQLFAEPGPVLGVVSAPKPTTPPPPLSTLNLSQYLTPAVAGTAPTLANVATAQNYADVAALESLLGSNYSVPLPITSATANQAGTDSAGTPLGINLSGISQAVAPDIAAAESFLAKNQKDFGIPVPNPNLPAEKTQMQTILQYLTALQEA